MKKLLISLGAIAFAMNAAATSTLDQAKLNTVAKLYENQDLELYLTDSFAKLQFRAIDIYNQDVAYEGNGESFSGCNDAFDLAPVQYGKPMLNIAKNNVNATFKGNKNITLSYQFECKKGKCLISDVITEKKRSHKKYLVSCIKAFK